MNKKTYTTLFTIISTIINIICTLLLILALIAISTLIMNKGFKCQNGQIYMIVYMFCFLGGMVLNMFIFGKVSGIIIDKFNLAEKLDPKMIGKTLPGGKRNQAAYKEEMNRPKTKMPDSVLDKEDDWGVE